MGWLADIRRDVRAEGLYLDAEQARVMLGLIERSYATGLVVLSPKETELFNRFVKRCQELKP
jgi:hypothetical protein